MTESRAIELSVEVAGTPEEVWDAIATGPGISSWFIPMDIEERAGGTVTMDFGAMGREEATVVAWDPPRRVVFEGSENMGIKLAYEWLVEARDGGTCVVRLVNSGFGPEGDFDGDYAGMTEGWRMFMQNLRLQLAHFRGQRAQAVIPTVPLPGPNRAAWGAFCAALGIPSSASTGERVKAEGPGAPPLSAQVDTVMRGPASMAYVLLFDGPLQGTGLVAAEGTDDTVMCSLWLYLYGEGAEQAASDWSGWMADRFPPPAPAPA